jgi:hypothetical protein
MLSWHTEVIELVASQKTVILAKARTHAELAHGCD